MQNRIFTIGSSDRSKEEFINILKKSGISLLVDVRSKTGSRTLHFDESRFNNLSKMLRENGIGYDASLHKELGGFQNGKTTIGNFRRYTQSSPSFSAALDSLKEKVRNNDGNVVILCCERDPKQCHRKVIGDILEADGWLAFHLE